MATPKETPEEKAEKLLSPVVTRLRNYVSKQKEDYNSEFIEFQVNRYRNELMYPGPPAPDTSARAVPGCAAGGHRAG